MLWLTVTLEDRDLLVTLCLTLTADCDFLANSDPCSHGTGFSGLSMNLKLTGAPHGHLVDCSPLAPVTL